MMKISPAAGVTGTVTLPGDKSISHRAAIVAALSEKQTRIRNFSTSADCISTLECLEQLGVGIRKEVDGITIQGLGRCGWKSSAAVLDCGNSGSTLRMLSGVLAGALAPGERVTLVGDASLARRPMGRIVTPLQQMGANISATDGHAPLTVSGVQSLHAIRYELPVASAQVKSCLLLAALNAEGISEIVEPTPTRDHTERMLRAAGVELSRDASTLRLVPPSHLRLSEIHVPNDLSSAVFFIGAVAMLPNSSLDFPDVGYNPTRTACIEVLPEWGVNISFNPTGVSAGEVRGDLHVTSSNGAITSIPPSAAGTLRIAPAILEGERIPLLIDELPLLAVVGSQLPHGLIIRDAGELRIKESDRLHATAVNLRAMGAEVEETPDGLGIGGKTRLRGAVLDSFGDHRIAMAFSVAALAASGDSEIIGAECVGVSCPNFYELLADIARNRIPT